MENDNTLLCRGLIGEGLGKWVVLLVGKQQPSHFLVTHTWFYLLSHEKFNEPFYSKATAEK